MKKTPLYWVFLLGIMMVLTGCGVNGSGASAKGKVLIYTTIFPLEDFARKIGGKHVEVKNLVPAGTDAHHFELSAKDMAKILEADLFIYNGVGIEPWAEQVVQNLDKEKTQIVNSVEGFDLLHADKHKEKQIKKGHGHKQDHEQMNPHVWLDPELAKKQAQKIRDALIKKDPAHKEDYIKNYQSLEEKFNQLHQEFAKMTNQAPKKVFAVSHNAFGYLADRYGLQQIAISGLSPSDEPSPQELKKIIETVKKYNVQYILFETLVSSRIAEAVKKEVNAEALTLHPLEGLTKQEKASGEDYFSIMKKNKEVLAKALGVKS